MSLASEDRHIFTYTEAKNQLIPGSCAKWVRVTADTAKAHEENCKEAEKRDQHIHLTFGIGGALDPNHIKLVRTDFGPSRLS